MNVRQKASRFATVLGDAVRAGVPNVQVWLDSHVWHGGYPTLIVHDGNGRCVPVTLFIKPDTSMCPILLAEKLIARLSAPRQAA